MRHAWLVAFVVAWMLPGLGRAGVFDPAACDGVPALRSGTALESDALSRGVNMTDALRPGISMARVREDMVAVRAAGLRHVRIPIEPALVLRWLPSGPADAMVQRLDGVVCAALVTNLAVILDMHPEGELALKDRADDEVVVRLAEAWGRLAGRYATVPPGSMVFEVVNEPGVSDQARWVRLQTALLERIRAVAPRHTILLTASPGSTAGALEGMAPVADANVAYVFHFYSPMVFTHQAADWSSAELGTVRGLAWPPRPGNVAAVRRTAAAGMQRALSELTGRGGGVAALRAEVGRAAAWAARHPVRLVATEIGAYGAADPASRAAWLRDVREALEARGIGWTVWEYRGGFGIDRALAVPCGGRGSVRGALGLCAGRRHPS